MTRRQSHEEQEARRQEVCFEEASGQDQGRVCAEEEATGRDGEEGGSFAGEESGGTSRAGEEGCTVAGGEIRAGSGGEIRAGSGDEAHGIRARGEACGCGAAEEDGAAR
jgi:hypothetical protein